MKLTPHGKNLWQITRFGAFNNYLVQEADGLTLIDTNLGGSQKAILAAAQTIGLPITRITLTHAHGDHVGSLDEMAALLPEAEVAFAHARPNFYRATSPCARMNRRPNCAAVLWSGTRRRPDC
jgi:glyoxylase-like metal-dependent hydrolase (beta-lactamase superfamily II)